MSVTVHLEDWINIRPAEASFGAHAYCLVYALSAVVLYLQGGTNAGLRAWGIAQIVSFGKSKQVSARVLLVVAIPQIALSNLGQYC